jgi:hypothetical protein
LISNEVKHPSHKGIIDESKDTLWGGAREEDKDLFLCLSNLSCYLQRTKEIGDIKKKRYPSLASLHRRTLFHK